ncbi:MAG TPA: DnaB-like helicase C-terminal domain-containing protein [Gemmatimonadales bacterium]|nr:DnaB-like helicase C-terminal domain-containing protein [Gemmatimonadales bacterium]
MKTPPDIPRRSNPVTDVVGRVDARLGGAASSDTVATGFPSVDRILGGGLRQGDLVVLGGDVGVGKSSFALAVALRIAERGETAAVISGEMDEDRLWERALAIEARTRLDDIRRGTVSDEARAALGAAAVRLRNRPLVYRPMAARSFEEVADRLRALHTPFAAVDFLQLLPPTRADVERAEQDATAVRLLKEIALEANVALLLVAQLPRLNPKRRDPRPSLDDFGALGAVKYHADVVLGLYREEMYQVTRGVEGATELIVAKNRHGATGFVDLYFYRDWMRFEDMLEPDR